MRGKAAVAAVDDRRVPVIPSEVEESLTISGSAARDVSTPLDMTNVRYRRKL
jgi:hypothetical protein